jgi:hypothetical protein
VTRDVLLQQLDAAEAQLKVLGVMLVGMRHTLGAPQAKMPDLPATCAGESDENCARLNPDAVIQGGGMSGNGPRMCKGCGLDPQT